MIELCGTLGGGGGGIVAARGLTGLLIFEAAGDVGRGYAAGPFEPCSG